MSSSPPELPKARLKFFHGTSNDLNALQNQIANWLDSTNVTPRHFSIAPHCQPGSQPGEETWFVLVTIVYVQPPPPPGTQIVRPRLHFTQPPVD